MTVTSDRMLFRYGVLEHSGIQYMWPYLRYAARPLTTDLHKLPSFACQEFVIAEVVKMHVKLVIARDGTGKLSNECDKRILSDLLLRETPFHHLVSGLDGCMK